MRMSQKTRATPPNVTATSWLHDQRTDCFSALIQVRTGDYLELVKHAHEQRGGIAGQREVLKTTTAKRIRNRMISDIQAGAVLPPVVIGVVVDSTTAGELEKAKHDQITLMRYVADKELSIIDGMQRTASLLEAGTADSAVFDRGMRVEFWIAKSVRAFDYRMLVLNTGQVPWTLARQLSVVYAPLLHEIKQHVKGLAKLVHQTSLDDELEVDNLVPILLLSSISLSRCARPISIRENRSPRSFPD